MGKWIQGILCLLLQITIVGWLPATIWSFVSISNYNNKRNDERLAAMVTAIKATNTQS